MWGIGRWWKWLNMHHKMMRMRIDVMVMMTMPALYRLVGSFSMKGITKIESLGIHIWQQQEKSIEVKIHMQLPLIFATLVQVVSAALDFFVLL